MADTTPGASAGPRSADVLQNSAEAPLAVLSAPPVLPVALGLTAPAFQMLGSDEVGVCVDGVCAVPTTRG